MNAVYTAGAVGILLVLIIAAASFGKTGDSILQAIADCNVRGYTLYGDLVTAETYAGFAPSDPTVEAATSGGMYTLSDDIVDGIEVSENDNTSKATLIEIDSYGGQAVAAEEIAAALSNATKPTVVLIRSAGLSAAYWAATGGDVIFASENSDVGSIGVVLTYLDTSKKNEEEGITYNSITSGKFKDTGSPYKLLTTEERTLLQRDVDILHKNFVTAVSQNRNIPEEDVAALADGSSMMGTMALEHGLIDRIGSQKTVEAYLAEELGEDVEICWNEY